MLPGTGNRHAVQQFKKVEIQRLKQRLSSTFFNGELNPSIERFLRLTEDFVDPLRRSQLFIDLRGIAFISKSKLIFQINELVVDRRGGKHQDFCPYACPNHFIEQFQIAVFFCRFAGYFAAVAEIMAFVNHDEVIIAPIQALKVNAIGLPVFTREVRMIQHIIAQPIFCNRVVNIVAFICIPVFGKLLRAQDQN